MTDHRTLHPICEHILASLKFFDEQGSSQPATLREEDRETLRRALLQLAEDRDPSLIQVFSQLTHLITVLHEAGHGSARDSVILAANTVLPVVEQLEKHHHQANDVIDEGQNDDLAKRFAAFIGRQPSPEKSSTSTGSGTSLLELRAALQKDDDRRS